MPYCKENVDMLLLGMACEIPELPFPEFECLDDYGETYPAGTGDTCADNGIYRQLMGINGNMDLIPIIPESAQEENELKEDNDGNDNDCNDVENNNNDDDEDYEHNDNEGSNYGSDPWSTETCIADEDLLERQRTVFNSCEDCELADVDDGQTPRLCMECVGLSLMLTVMDERVLD